MALRCSSTSYALWLAPEELPEPRGTYIRDHWLHALLSGRKETVG